MQVNGSLILSWVSQERSALDEADDAEKPEMMAKEAAAA